MKRSILWAKTAAEPTRRSVGLGLSLLFPRLEPGAAPGTAELVAFLHEDECE